MFHDATTNLLISTYFTCRHRCGWTDDIKNIFSHRGGPGSIPGSPCSIWYLSMKKVALDGTYRRFTVSAKSAYYVRHVGQSFRLSMCPFVAN